MKSKAIKKLKAYSKNDIYNMPYEEVVPLMREILPIGAKFRAIFDSSIEIKFWWRVVNYIEDKDSNGLIIPLMVAKTWNPFVRRWQYVCKTEGAILGIVYFLIDEQSETTKKTKK